MALKPYYEQDGITLYHGDCREIMPSIVDVGFVLTDPPYGIDYSAEKMNYPGAHGTQGIVGDKTLELASWLLLGLSAPAVVWGANNFPQLLPVPGVWLCWDKRVTEAADGVFGWPFELAWSNKVKGKAKIYRIQHGGVINADKANGKRLHPTQKPVRLFEGCINDFSKGDELIVDPFVGSGTTLRAAKNLGRRAVGIEIEEKYCEIAAKRLGQNVMNFSEGAV